MNKFFKEDDIVKFNSDFFNTHTNIIARDIGVSYSTVEFIKTHCSKQAFKVSWCNGRGSMVYIVDTPRTNKKENGLWCGVKWLDFYKQEIYINKKEVIELM